MTIEERDTTTWEGRCISTRPLPPVPLFPRTTPRMAASTARVRKSSKATRRTAFSNRPGSKVFSFVRTRMREGGANGSRCTLSMKREKLPRSYVPERSL
jgi:hypothetical protein